MASFVSSIDPSFRKPGCIPEWVSFEGLCDYPSTLMEMEGHVDMMVNGRAGEAVWLLEHPSLYTIGTSGNAGDILKPGLPVYHAGRGGQVTWHGPGQRVIYVMLDLNHRKRDLRGFIRALESWVIETLRDFGIHGHTAPNRTGVWVSAPSEAKIAAIGVRVRKWITFHGIAVNIHPDLTFFRDIIPCGIREFGVTSFQELNVPISISAFDEKLKKNFGQFF